MTIQIPYNFTPREYQKPLYNAIADGYKRGVSIWHRRAGKDKTFINLITKEAIKRVGVYYYFFPTYNQGRKILWDGIDKNGFPFLGHVPVELRKATNASEMKITLVNNSIIQVVGTDNIDSIVGTNPIGCVFSEYSLQNPKGWEFIRPILAENGGWAFFNFTPRGHNHGYELSEMAKKNPEWFHEILTVIDTGAITQEQINAERKAGMTEDLINQEFYCSFEASIVGAYFANEMRAATEQGRITRVPIEPNIPVHSFWDIGIDDSTTLWLVQFAARETHIVGCYANSGEALAHYGNWLKDWRGPRGATLGTIYLPHDGNTRSVQTAKTPQEMLKEMGFDVEVIERPLKKELGIEASRQAFGNCYFDDKECFKGIDALRQYRKEYDEVNGVYKIHAVHDWTSHYADGFQTYALWKQKQRLELGEDYDDDESESTVFTRRQRVTGY
jgi:hypothetical protein